MACLKSNSQQVLESGPQIRLHTPLSLSRGSAAAASQTQWGKQGSGTCCKSLGKLSPLLGFFRIASAAAAKSLQSCPTLCDPADGSPLHLPVICAFQFRGQGAISKLSRVTHVFLRHAKRCMDPASLGDLSCWRASEQLGS